MPEVAIRVEKLSKLYQIGARRAVQRSFRETITEAAASPFRRLFSRNGCPTPQPTTGTIHRNGNASTIWALRDVSFEVQPGEVVGIIGRNGAGKSTLLKILSRITEPTEGYADMNGRVGSLLEVGTGFHSELTGRENIYLNGAILGMRRAEISRKFDEIVAFAEVEKFIDTPVKHYSSGMYMRLAFGVAAHLEPEILLVDEVLAVGDADFQKKCLGKMGDVAKKGRTVLFVSHNMGAILSLCQKCFLIDQGRVKASGNTREVTVLDRDMRPPISSFQYGDTMHIVIETNPVLPNKFGIELRIRSSRQHLLGYVSSWIKSGHQAEYKPGDSILITIPDLPLVQDRYYVDLICRVPKVNHIDVWWDCFSFLVTRCQPGASLIPLQGADQLGSVVFEQATVAPYWKS